MGHLRLHYEYYRYSASANHSHNGYYGRDHNDYAYYGRDHNDYHKDYAYYGRDHNDYACYGRDHNYYAYYGHGDSAMPDVPLMFGRTVMGWKMRG